MGAGQRGRAREGRPQAPQAGHTCAPPLLAATLCGLIVSVLQAVTQIQDQTLPYVVKLLAVSVTLAAVGRWFGSELMQLTSLAFTMIPGVGR